MGLVTVCKYQRAKIPFLIEQAGLHVYSLEELCWFLYHNIFLADRQFFNEKLCKWIAGELSYPELAQRIQNGIASGMNFQNLVISILSSVDMFTNEELKELGEQLKKLNSLQEQERLKLRADELLDNGKEWMAIETYQKILKIHENTRLGVSFYASIWNNLGVCYARQFLFEEATKCFAASYEYDLDESVKEHENLARKLAKNQISEDDLNMEFLNPQKTLLEWEKDYRLKQKR